MRKLEKNNNNNNKRFDKTVGWNGSGGILYDFSGFKP